MKMNDAKTPQDYGLDHEKFREYQQDNIEWSISLPSSSVGIIEAPTGSGKTSIAKALSTTRSVIALCRTKNLQDVNYGQKYGAQVLFGRGNYECIHPDVDEAMCDECMYIDTSMHKCEWSSRCLYLLAKDAAQKSPFSALNYHYFMISRWPREIGAGAIILDEAHQLSDIVLDFVGCTITQKDVVDWDLPPIPEIKSQIGVIIKTGPPPNKVALAWLNSAVIAARLAYKREKSARNKKRMKKCQSLGIKLSATFDALRERPDDWYIKSGAHARKVMGKTVPGFICKPLTARHHFSNFFLNEHTTISMSATIGNREAFTEELGIDDYDMRVVPNRFNPEERKVHVLDVPRMGYKSTLLDYDKQAQAIADAILDCPGEWSGLVHVTRKREAQLLAKRLADKGLGDRMWIMPGWDGTYTPTDEQVSAWDRRRREVPNSICVTWALWEGYDGTEEKINIVAKVPFPFLGSEYERERLSYSNKWYLQRAAYQLEQGCGRTRRGFEEDYGDENGFVAIADANVTRVEKYLSKSAQEALVK
jgi:Rad3-related DNA helicase